MSNGRIPNGTIGNGRIAQGDDTVLHDLEDEPIQTISKNVNLAVANGIHHMAQQQAAITIPKISSNGMIGNKIASLNEDRRNNIRELYGRIHSENHI